MYCHNCGTETTDRQTYCTACGAELAYQPSHADSETDNTASPAEPADPRDSAGHKTPEQRTDHQDHSKPSPSQPPHRDEADSETALTTPSQNPAGADQTRELAGNALFGYTFIVLFRLTGLSGILFQPHAENPFFSTGLHDIGVFIFYHGFPLAIIALVTSAYLTARHYLNLSLPLGTRNHLDTAATIGLSGSSLLYILGTLVAFLG